MVGPTHNFAGLSPGNIASLSSEGTASNPRAAALEGLGKMRFVRGLGVTQAVLPPQPRPHLAVLRAFGFTGADEAVIAEAARHQPELLKLASSASSMWAANAATVAPSTDTTSGRLVLVVANLETMFHRALEAETTHAVLSRLFADPARFTVRRALPRGDAFGDEGAANHTRLTADGGALHLFAWGRRGFGAERPTQKFVARQTLEASRAVARMLDLPEERCAFIQQDPRGIDAGAFHTDVVGVGNQGFFMHHELAFAEDVAALLRARIGGVEILRASADELPIADAVSAYPFNSQVLTLPSGEMTIVAPKESEDNPRARAFLERVTDASALVTSVHYIDVRQSMKNGGGPACLRLRVPMTDAEVGAIGARVVFDEALEAELVAWVGRHYRDRLVPSDLADPALHRESMAALDALTSILRLGSVYDFQRTS